MWLWIWPGDPELADESLLPNLDETGYNDPRFTFRPFFSMEIEGRYQLLNDNLSDLTHLAYLHKSSIGVEANASVLEEREETERVLRSRRRLENVPLFELARGRYNYDGSVDRLTGMDFYLPGFHAGIDETSIPTDHPTRGGEKLNVGRVYHAVTPARLHSTNYFFSMGGILSDADFDFLKEHLRNTVQEDVFATVEIEKMLNAIGRSPQELMLKSDMSAVRGRRALQVMMDKEKVQA
jgi:vanillate O-demethylase monooxygenase subunit